MSSYAGRLTDLLIFQVPGVVGVSEAVKLSIGAFPQVCAGPQKAAQAFALALLTRANSVLHEPEYGTTLLDELASGLLRDDEAIRGVVASATREVINYLTNNASETTPDDELIQSAEIEKLERTQSHVSARIRLTTLAGDSRVYLIPLTALPR